MSEVEEKMNALSIIIFGLGVQYMRISDIALELHEIADTLDSPLKEKLNVLVGSLELRAEDLKEIATIDLPLLLENEE